MPSYGPASSHPTHQASPTPPTHPIITNQTSPHFAEALTRNPRLWVNGALAVATTAIAVRQRRARQRQHASAGQISATNVEIARPPPGPKQGDAEFAAGMAEVVHAKRNRAGPPSS